VLDCAKPKFSTKRNKRRASFAMLPKSGRTKPYIIPSQKSTHQFGWSAGDIAECVKILIKIGQALKESSGSTEEYRHAVDFLKGVETTVRGVEAIFLNHPDLTFQSAFQEHTTNLITAITHFRRKTEGYESSLGDNATTSRAKKAWKKIKLALFGYIEELKSDILYPQSIVNNLIGLQAL
jgi:hypothetical protein